MLGVRRNSIDKQFRRYRRFARPHAIVAALEFARQPESVITVTVVYIIMLWP
jgi:hypothetical protein